METRYMHTRQWSGLVVVGTLSAAILCYGEVVRRGEYQLTRRAESASLVADMDLCRVVTNKMPSLVVKHQSVNTTTNEFRLVVTATNSIRNVQSKITVRVEPSVAAAEDYILTSLVNISVMLLPGSPSGIQVGDRSWYRIAEETESASVRFLRHNVAVYVFSHDATTSEAIARVIDEAIVNRAMGVTFREAATPPRKKE